MTDITDMNQGFGRKKYPISGLTRSLSNGKYWTVLQYWWHRYKNNVNKNNTLDPYYRRRVKPEIWFATVPQVAPPLRSLIWKFPEPVDHIPQ